MAFAQPRQGPRGPYTVQGELPIVRSGSILEVLVCLLLFVLPAAAQAPPPAHLPDVVSPVSIQHNQQLFAALCAAYAGGYPIEPPESQTSFRIALLRELNRQGAFSKTPGPALAALREFYRKHESADPAATLARYVSYALLMGAPPRFELTVSREEEPPDVLALEGFSEVLAAWYQEAHLDQLYQRAEPAYEREARRLDHSLSQTILLETGYVREVLRPSTSRTFTVYAEPLVGSRSNFRTYSGRYFLVVDPQRESVADEIRHSMLHFLLDPLALAHHPPLEGRKRLLDQVARAPRIPIEYREDIVALTDECLVKAVELRIQKLPPGPAQAALDAAEADGFVLMRPIYNGLDAYEKSPDPFSAYYETLLSKISLTAEAKRLADVKFAPLEEANAENPAAPPTPAAPPPAPLSELDEWLAQGESQLAEKDTRSARATFERILVKYPNVPRAQYGLAVCVVVDGEEDRGKALLEQVISELNPMNGAPASPGTTLAGEAAPALPASALADPRTLAWAHVWLGRIYDQRGLHDLAGVEYHAALAVESAPQAALAAARRGLEGEKPPGGSRP